MRHTWTDKENARVLALIRKSRTHEDALQLVKEAFPTVKVNSHTLQNRLYALGKGSISANLAPPLPVKGESAEDIRRVVALSKGGNRTLEDLCNTLDTSPKRVEALLKEAQKRGFAVALHASGTVGVRPAEPLAYERKVILPPGETQGFFITSDIHVGSTFFLKDQFQDFVQRQYDSGLRTCLVPGDILDGCYRHSKWEETHHGFQAQADYAAEVFPKLPGLQYIGITGNHDETFETDSGLSVVRSLVQVFRDRGRDDLSLLGARGAYVRLARPGERGVLVEMWHPCKGVAYALSYKMQKHIEGYAPGQKPDILLVGHWHQQCYFTQRGVHAMSCGTWHGGLSPFGKSLGGAPAIGGWSVRFAQTKGGTVRELTPTWSAYYEREEVRKIGLT